MAPPRHHHHQQHHGHHGHHGNNNGVGPGGFGSSGGGQASVALNGGGQGIQDGGAAGLPPAPHRVDTTQAQTYRLQDAYWSDEEEDMDCPLCLEEIDISDANFKPCPCGYQICRFCWHHIKQNLNGRCPACRRKYSDNMVEFKPMSQDEIKRLAQAKKQKEREKRELEQMNRKHLANMRVVQKNLVYVVGMDAKLAREELIPTLRSNEYFGQYGRISKILISKRTTASKLIMGTQESSIGVYVTYVRKEDAARAIIAIDGSKGSDGRTIRASYGTTKYCTTYLRNLPCTNPICTYLHEPGEDADSFTKEDLTTLRHAAKDAEGRARPAPVTSASSFHAATRPHEVHSTATGIGFGSSAPGTPGSGVPTAPAADSLEGSALPKTASWASGKPVPVSSAGAQSSVMNNADLPPLSALTGTPNSRKPSQRVPGSPAAVKTPIRGRVQSGRPDSPAPSRSESGSPAPPPPPGLDKSVGHQSSRRTNAVSGSLEQETKDTAEESISGASSATLTKHGAPPGLSSRSATPSADTASSASEPKTASNYQPSSTAQAVLDDMRARREAEASQPTKSPFPDFDATLSSFRDGDDFCFTLEESLVPAHIRNGTGHGGAGSQFAPNAFAAFSSTPAYANVNGLASASSATPPPPGLGGALNEELQTYSGSFDPFATDAGEKLPAHLEERLSLGAVDDLRRSLNEVEQTPNGESREGEENTASRFGFAKRRGSFKTSDDLLGFIRGGSLMGGTSSTQQHEGSTNQPFNPSPFADPTQNGPGGESMKGNGWLMGAPSAHLQSQEQRGSPLASILPLQMGAGATGSYPTSDRNYFGPTPDAPNGPMQGTLGADYLLLAQLMNRKPNETPSYNDSAALNYARHQRQQPQPQQHAFGGFPTGSQQQGQPHMNSSAFAGFSPFDSQSPYTSGLSNNASRPGSGYQQQPHQPQHTYGNHRTFA